MNPERILVEVVTHPIDPAALSAFVGTPGSGGVVTFSGNVRNEHQGRGVVSIEYSAVPELARAKLADLAAEVLRDPEIHRVAAVHRTGLLRVGEASVVVAASAAHREAAFRAARALIDRIKQVVPVWKNERFDDGTTEWAPGFSVPEADRSPGVTPEGATECS
ncbi:MAG: hypothetical protein DHS20C21_24720 [Gemmatimonadota bacterium]|nr:MAG: hypothetical protein DHS20C21_24720 [Gemmatimonadota bacterium]